MTREDIDRLFDLLAIYRPGDRHLEDKRLRSAWLLVLEPYKPADVKQALGAYLRESKYWPDPSDIAMRCPKAMADRPPEQKQRTNFSDREIAQVNAQMEEMLELGQLMALEYEDAGVPHPALARTVGWSCRTWIEKCRGSVV